MTKLRDFREEVDPRIAQEQVAHLAGIRLNTYRRAEAGGKITYTTAKKILEAVNSFREGRNLPLYTLDDLDLNIV